MKKSKKMRTIPKKSNGPNIFERMQMRRVEKDAYTSIIADSFCGVNWHEKLKIFPVFTVYKNPRDFPGKYVVRLFDGTRPMRLITIVTRWMKQGPPFPKDSIVCKNRRMMTR